MQVTEELIRNVVSQVLAEVGRAPAAVKTGFTGRYGIFTDVQEATDAARDAFEQLSTRTIEDRRRIIQHIRRISVDQCVELRRQVFDVIRGMRNQGLLDLSNKEVKTMIIKAIPQPPMPGP
jgi:hypothetical protein